MPHSVYTSEIAHTMHELKPSTRSRFSRAARPMPLTERQAQEKVLFGLFGEPEPEKKQNRPEHAYEAMRREIREQVCVARCCSMRSLLVPEEITR